MDATITRAKEAIGKIPREWGYSVLVAQVLAIVIFPIFEILLALPVLQTHWVIWVVAIAAHTLVGFYALRAALKLNDFLALTDIHRLDAGIADLRATIATDAARQKELFSQYQEQYQREFALQVSLSALSKMLQHPQKEPAEEGVKTLLQPLVANRATALGFRSSEYFNFVVYLFDTKANVLRVLHRNCDDRMERHDRTWKPGVGHVGLSYARGETLLKQDAKNDKTYTGRFSLPTDDIYYRSYISSPIMHSAGRSKASIGVFVITSSRPYHFNKDDKMIVEGYALLFSTYFSCCIQAPRRRD